MHVLFFVEFLTSSGGALGLAQPLTLLANSCRASGPRNTLGGMNSPLAFTTATTLSTVSREHTGTCVRSASIFSTLPWKRSSGQHSSALVGCTELLLCFLKLREPVARSCACVHAATERISRGDWFKRSVWLPVPRPPAARRPPSAQARAATPHRRDQRRPWRCTQRKHSLLQHLSLWCALSKTFLLLSSPDQRLLLFLLLLLILFSALIAQSSLTMTLMLMRRWRGCFNELQSTSEELGGGYREGIGSTEHQNTASTPATAFHQPWPLCTALWLQNLTRKLRITAQEYTERKTDKLFCWENTWEWEIVWPLIVLIWDWFFFFWWQIKPGCCLKGGGGTVKLTNFQAVDTYQWTTCAGTSAWNFCTYFRLNFGQIWLRILQFDKQQSFSTASNSERIKSQNIQDSGRLCLEMDWIRKHSVWNFSLALMWSRLELLQKEARASLLGHNPSCHTWYQVGHGPNWNLRDALSFSLFFKINLMYANMSLNH